MKTAIYAASLITGLLLNASVQGAPAAAATPAVSASGNVSRIAPRTAPVPQPSTLAPAGSPGNNVNGTSTLATNQALSSNQLGAATNQLQNSNNLTTAGNQRPVNGTAASAGDQALLRTLNQGLQAQLVTTSPTALPVHFLVNNGAVTLVGTIPSADESQRILQRVRQTPGVLSVFNDLRVGPTARPVTQTGMFGPVTDHAFSPADRTLLTTVEQEAGTQLGITAASAAQMPVHFSIQNGVVGVTGSVNSPQEKQALLAAIARTPGITRVVDDVSLIPTSSSPTGTPAANGSLSPTSNGQSQPNRVFMNTNSSGY